MTRMQVEPISCNQGCRTNNSFTFSTHYLLSMRSGFKQAANLHWKKLIEKVGNLPSPKCV